MSQDDRKPTIKECAIQIMASNPGMTFSEARRQALKEAVVRAVFTVKEEIESKNRKG